MGEEKQLRQFGKFRLDVQKKVLWHGAEPVNLPLKEVELLCVLTDNVGEVVTKEELFNKLWANSFVEDSNLSRHIYLLRKTFKDFGEEEELIQTVPRRGYRFAGEVREAGPGELVIEKHSLTQTLIEEIGNSKETETKSIPASLSFGKFNRVLLPIMLGATILVAVLGFYFYRQPSKATPSDPRL